MNQYLVDGFIILIVGSVVSWIVGKFLSVDLPAVCKDWNKFYVMEICLFLTGVLASYLKKNFKFKKIKI